MNETTTTTTTPPNHSLAIVSLVLSILGLISVLPVIGSIGAVITGYIALDEIRKNPSQYSGENLARAGLILGWIGIAIVFLLALIAILALLIFIPVSGPFLW